MPTTGRPRPPADAGRYEVRDHSVKGLASLVHIGRSGIPAEILLTVGQPLVPVIAHAFEVYLAGAGGEYERGRAAMLDELAQMDAAERADVLSRARHPSTRAQAPAPLRALPGGEAQ